jgi:hypothetical protein
MLYWHIEIIYYITAIALAGEASPAVVLVGQASPAVALAKAGLR